MIDLRIRLVIDQGEPHSSDRDVWFQRVSGMVLRAAALTGALEPQKTQIRLMQPF